MGASNYHLIPFCVNSRLYPWKTRQHTSDPSNILKVEGYHRVVVRWRIAASSKMVHPTPFASVQGSRSRIIIRPSASGSVAAFSTAFPPTLTFDSKIHKQDRYTPAIQTSYHCTVAQKTAATTEGIRDQAYRGNRVCLEMPESAPGTRSVQLERIILRTVEHKCQCGRDNDSFQSNNTSSTILYKGPTSRGWSRCNRENCKESVQE